LCKENEIGITEVDKLKIDGFEVSSTKIKEFFQNGNVENANKFLGRNYSMQGIVKEGKKLGRKMGFPTVNLTAQKSVAFKNGVYVTKTHINNEIFNSITNVGVNPTVDLDEKTKIETYIFDFYKEIYGKTIKVEFLHHLRDERKFENIDELVVQIAQDKENCKKYFEKNQ
jgi:riboflavin kinase/FMN adenylyltransferase